MKLFTELKTRRAYLLILILCHCICFSQVIRHKFRRQPYLQGNTDYIGQGKLGLESVFIFENDYNVPDTFYLPNNDITYGINDNLEVILGLNSFYSKNTGWGIQPVDLAFKYNIFDEDTKVPQIDFVGKVQSQGIGTHNLAISKSLPSFSVYATKNFSSYFHSVFDTGLNWLDTSSKESFTMDLYNEFEISKKLSTSFEVNEFSTDRRFWNLIFGIGAIRDISDSFSLEFNCGKYLKSTNQNYYFSFGFNKIFTLKKT